MVQQSSAQANGPSAADINRSFAEPSVDSPLIEPRPEVLPSLNGKKNGNAEAVPLAVSNGTVSPPVRRKVSCSCCHLSQDKA